MTGDNKKLLGNNWYAKPPAGGFFN